MECPYEEALPPCSLQGGPTVDLQLSTDCLLGGEDRGEQFSLRSRTLRIQQSARLVVHPKARVELLTGALRLDGELWVGCSPEKPHEGDFQLRLLGSGEERDAAVHFSWRQAGLPDVADGDGPSTAFPKALLVTSTGRLELHGCPRASWQYLKQTALRGDTKLVLSEAVNWRPGDSVVVGASSEDLEDSEMARILAVKEAGKVLLLQEKLRARHEGAFGERRLNAPVGLLTRNLRISGDSQPEPETVPERWAGCRKAYSSVALDATALSLRALRRACWGGHLLFVQNSTIHIEHSEFSLLGQALEMARYPVHWHLAGNAYGHFIRNSSLHHNFQRCVTVHGSEGVEVQSNVCFQTFGHAVYLEDGIETGNIFKRNLIMSVHQGGSVCSDWVFGKGARSNLQLGPSGFWITNPNNSFSENHVIGVGTGYWFTFPGSNGCGLAALPAVELCRRRNPVAAMGLSARYFNDTRSGHGFGSWWLRQEPSRTRVPVFRRNAVGTATRGVHVDGRVLNSADEHAPCWGDACSSCSGPLEGSSSWVPMRFDPSLPLAQRSYRFQANHFEDFLAAHITGGPAESESRAVWTSGGYIHFTGAVFWNCRHVAASMPELTTACFKVTEASPPGFTLVFESSLFISGDVSETFFQLYDAGIHVKNSRWLLAASTSPSFRVAKPKCAFGGNGNPIYLEGSRELRQTTKDRFAWAVQAVEALGTGIRLTSASQIVSFECIAWESPYIEGSYVYSPDSFGLERATPTILAPDRAQRTSRRVLGLSACAAYLKSTKPRFFCGESFGTYGLWCGSGIPVEECPGAADATNWYHSMLPWSRGERSEDVVGSGTSPVPVWAEAGPDPPAGDCHFPNRPPHRTPFTWDPSCLGGGLGCNADGSHMECRWCGFDPYPPCPETQEAATGDSDLFVGLVSLLLSAAFLSLLAALCWYCTSRRRARARPSCISQIPRQEAPSLLGRTTLPVEKPPIRDLPGPVLR